MTTDNENAETPENVEKERSFFARGALLGIVGGAVFALLLISVAGSVVSIVDDLFGSSTPAVADAPPVSVDPVVAAGEALSNSAGCAACHSVDGVDGVGPTWKGLGSKVDEAYLTRSILDPNADIADGFTTGLMPETYNESLSDDDVAALVAYISSL